MLTTFLQKFAHLHWRQGLLLAILIALALSLFFYVHGSLPRWLRAPSSLLLAPIAAIDGLCYYLGLPGIYGKFIPMFVSMFSAIYAVLLLASAILRRRFH